MGAKIVIISFRAKGCADISLCYQCSVFIIRLLSGKNRFLISLRFIRNDPAAWGKIVEWKNG